MIPFARELAAICDADASELENLQQPKTTAPLRALYRRGSDNDPHHMVAAAIRLLDRLHSYPDDEPQRLRALARRLRQTA
jgi:hypothetical protein